MPLLDRMEVVDLNGYTLDEKKQIAIRYLWPKQLREHGFGRWQPQNDRRGHDQVAYALYARSEASVICKEKIADYL